MARVEIDEWLRGCARRQSHGFTAVTSETSDTLTWAETPEQHPIERWDGETFYEVNHSWDNSSGPPVFGNLRGEYNFKYASNSDEFLSPVVGDGTGFIELNLSQLMILINRAKLIRPSIDWEFSGTLSSTATSIYDAIEFEFEVATDALNVAGTPSATLDEKNESMIYCGTGFNRWNTLGTTPSYLASIVYELFEDPDEFFIGTGTGSIIKNPNETMAVSSSGGGIIQVRAIDNPQITVFQIDEEPSVYFVRASQLWPVFSAGASCGIGTDFDGNIGASFSLRTGQPFIDTSFVEGDREREFYDDVPEDWITDSRIEQEIVTTGVSFSFLGDPINHPGLLKSTAAQLAFTAAIPSVTNSTNLTGSIDIQIQKYWPYKDASGTPLYDEDTGLPV